MPALLPRTRIARSLPRTRRLAQARRGLWLLLATSAAFAAAPPRVESIANASLERTFEISGGRVRTVSLRNKLNSRLYRVDSREFRLSLVWERLGYQHGQENPVTLTAADFEVDGVDRQAGDPQVLSFRLSNRQYSLRVKLVFTLGTGDFYLRKQLEIGASGNAPVFLDRIAVEDLAIAGGAPLHGGFGQPLYDDDLFLGLEYPGGYNTAADGRLTLSYYSGAITGPAPQWSERAVVGVAPTGGARRAFQNYIARIRSGKVRPALVFNTWYDMQRDSFTAANCRTRMDLLRKKLLEPYGIRLDSFVLDDGWDDRDSVWKIHAQKFGGDFTPLAEFLRAAGTNLGMWFGPVGGYDQRAVRIAAGRREGFEITANGRYFCLAGTRYREKFKSTVLEMVRKYGINHLKFDGIPYGCNAPGHGHLPGVYSREAHLRAFIDILQAVRAADPRVFLNITTSTWLSPWWLQYADVVFMGGLDYGFLQGVPAASERDKAITYRDRILYEDFRTRQYQFPNNSLMTIGIIKGTLGGEGGAGESLESWVRNAIMNFSRGSMFTELYVSPSILSDMEWRTLAAVIRWAQRNSDVLLADTRMILGDPGAREVYGYAHFAGRGIVTLRNPFIESRAVSVALDHAAGVEPGPQKYRARVVYPYVAALAGEFGFGDSVPLMVPGYEVVVVEFDPAQGSPAPAGLPAPAEWAPPVRTGLRQDAGEFAASLELVLPADVSAARLAVLCEWDGEGAAPVPRFRLNGNSVNAETVSPATTEVRLGRGEGRWVFYLLPLGTGENRIDVELANARGKVGAWLMAGLPRKPGPPLPGDALPAQLVSDRRVVHLFSRAIAPRP